MARRAVLLGSCLLLACAAPGSEGDDELGDTSDASGSDTGSTTIAATESSDSDSGSTAGSESDSSSDSGSDSDSESSSTGETGSDSESSSTSGDPEDCSTNPIPWCDEASLPRPNGVPVEPPGVDGCPPGMAKVDGFCVDRWEAALVEVLPGDRLAPWSPYQSPGDASVRALSAPGLVPQGYINQLQAAAACESAGKRLCTDSEWLRACQGASGFIYPYGDADMPGVCNDARTCHPAIQYFESAADWIWSELGHPCLNQLPEGLDATGENPGCVSEDGIFDMMGNLHEWTADPNGSFRGGFYVDTKINGPGCTYLTTAHNVSHWDYSTGFRCCADIP